MHTVRYGQAETSVKGEDFILADPSLNLFGVFDGVGGRPGGSEASRTVAESIQAFYQVQDSPGEPAAMTAALEASEVALHKRRQTRASLATMATTATVARIYWQNDRPTLAYGHVGDTRLYVLRGRTLHQITEDEGVGNILEQALGFLKEIVQTDIMPLQTGDRLMLCSDGITGDFPAELLTAEEMKNALTPSRKPQAAADELLRICRKHDDASVIVIDI